MRLSGTQSGVDEHGEVGERDEKKEHVANELGFEDARGARAVDGMVGLEFDDAAAPGDGRDGAVDLDPACEAGGAVGTGSCQRTSLGGPRERPAQPVTLAHQQKTAERI